MSPDSPWIVWAVVAPLIAALLAAGFGPRATPLVFLTGVLGVPVSAAALAVQVERFGPQRHAIGGWGEPLGIELYADGLAALMLLVSAVVGAAVSVYASGFFGAGQAPPVPVMATDGSSVGYGHAPPVAVAGYPGGAAPAPPRAPHGVLTPGMPDASGAGQALTASPPADARAGRFFWPLWMLLWAALNALFLSRDVFNLYVTLELMSLSAVALVTLGGTDAATVAGMRYLLMSLLGSLLFLLGVALLYAAYGTLSLDGLASAAAGALDGGGSIPPATVLALAVMTVGLCIKAALFPFHAWLPPAHASAPAPASALLSGLVVKAAFYILVRLWLQVLPVAVPGAALRLIGVLGAGAVLWGSVLALVQHNLKLLIAYSTVAQLGYLFLLFPLLTDGGSPAAGAWNDAAWSGGIYQALAHACAKAAMFLAAGSMIHASGSDALVALDGISNRLPLSFTAFGLGGLTMAGLPPSGGFIGKWLLLTAAFETGRWVWAGVIAGGGLLSAAYVYRVLRHAFGRSEALPPPAPVPRRMELAALGLALVAVALGVAATRPIELLEVGAGPLAPMTGAMSEPGGAYADPAPGGSQSHEPISPDSPARGSGLSGAPARPPALPGAAARCAPILTGTLAQAPLPSTPGP